MPNDWRQHVALESWVWVCNMCCKPGELSPRVNEGPWVGLSGLCLVHGLPQEQHWRLVGILTPFWSHGSGVRLELGTQPGGNYYAEERECIQSDSETLPHCCCMRGGGASGIVGIQCCSHLCLCYKELTASQCLALEVWRVSLPTGLLDKGTFLVTKCNHPSQLVDHSFKLAVFLPHLH